MRINTVASTNQETGYGRMGRNLLTALGDLGVGMDECSSPGDEHKPVHANALWMGAPSHVSGWWKGQRAHCLTMWEATGVPPGFRENIHEFETIICPSEQNRELFSHWHPNVRKVPLGINPALWYFQERKPVDNEFRFLTAGQGQRKGIDVVIRAFNAVFGDFQPSPDHPRPRLVVKNRYHSRGELQIRGEGITEISGTVSPQEEFDIYADAHCFVGMARGEGWGMMPFQAMAQGCPTILHDAHGYAEFAHLAALTVNGGLSKAEPFIFGDADQWWEPDFGECCEAMWDMYVNYDHYLGQARYAAQVIADEYTWADSARKLIEAMGGREALELPDIVAREWYKPTIQQFYMVTDRDWGCEVNGTVHKFVKGEDFWVLGDIKRMAFECGVLDPSCLKDIHESGLTPEQLSEVDRYRSEHQRCYACGQRYNSDLTLDFDDAEALTP